MRGSVTAPLVSAAFAGTTWVFIICIAVSAVRLMRGPRGADRLTALSLITSLVLAILVIFGIQDDRQIYLDAALVYDVLGFLGILGIASFIRERQE
jgi:multicomponent Na+:H+ antiporter subunit F